MLTTFKPHCLHINETRVIIKELYTASHFHRSGDTHPQRGPKRLQDRVEGDSGVKQYPYGIPAGEGKAVPFTGNNKLNLTRNALNMSLTAALSNFTIRT